MNTETTPTVMCAKYKKELVQLPKIPFPGTDGQRIFENVSARAWQEWLDLQTMIINENRLNLMDPDARAFLADSRDKFLFEGINIMMPDDYVEPTDYDPNIPDLR